MLALTAKSERSSSDRPANVVVGLGEPQRRDAHLVEDSAQRVVAEGVGIPLRHHHDGLLGPPRIFVRGRRIPARVRQIVLRVGRPLRRGKAQKLRRRNLALGGLLLDRGVLRQRLRAHIGGKQLRVPLFQPKVGGPLVAEERIAVANEELVDADHGGLGSRVVACNLRARATPPQSRARARNGSIHSKPHSSGRTTRFSSRVVSRVSHSYIHRA